MSATKSIDSIDDSNRRKSFRIDDTVTLRIRALDGKSFQNISDDFDAFRLRFSIKSHMQNQRDVRKPQLIRIKKTAPDVAEYLESLEAQFTQLAERIDQVSDVSGGCEEFSCRANLSSEGIRYISDHEPLQGQFLEVAMELSSSNTQVMMLGEVLRVEQCKDATFAVSVTYTHIHSDDREAIVRHMARLQQLALQARRGPSE